MAAISARRGSSGPKRGTACSMVIRPGAPSTVSMAIGTVPTSCSMRITPPEAAGSKRPSRVSTNAVPMVGWPAVGSSRAGVKMRTLQWQAGSAAGSTNVVSDRFSSRAMDW